MEIAMRGDLIPAWLNMPQMVYFIFFSMLALYAIAVFLIVCAVRNYRRRKNPHSHTHSHTVSAGHRTERSGQEDSEVELISLEPEEQLEEEMEKTQP